VYSEPFYKPTDFSAANPQQFLDIFVFETVDIELSM